MILTAVLIRKNKINNLCSIFENQAAGLVEVFKRTELGALLDK